MSLANEVIPVLWKLVCKVTQRKNNDFSLIIHYISFKITLYKLAYTIFPKITKVVKIVSHNL